jgi:putative cell wall-binding protein
MEAPMSRVAARPVVAVLCVALALALLPGLATGDPRDPGIAPGSGPASGGTYADGEIIVQFDSGIAVAAAQRRIHERLGGRIRASYPRLGGLAVVEIDPRMSVEEAVEAYSADPDVLHAQPNYEYRPAVIPNDEYFSVQWGLHNTGHYGTADADIDAPEAWDLETGSANVVVAVIDTGVDYTHPDLADNMWVNPAEVPGNGIDDDSNGYVDDVHGVDAYRDDGNPMDTHGHGTHVAGIVGASGYNSIGISGVNWDVSVMALRVADDAGIMWGSTIIEAIDYAREQGVTVINCSWGGEGTDAMLYNAMANTPGILYVCAAGNDGTDLDGPEDFYPAGWDLPNILTVGWSDQSDRPSALSNHGVTSVDVFAPGQTIFSTVPWTGSPATSYDYMSGTSMAAPHVAGIAALMLADDPSMSVTLLKRAIMASADEKTALEGFCVTGARANARGALTWANTAPVAVDDAVTTTWGDPVTFNVLTNDTDAEGDPLVAVKKTNPPSGTVSLAADGRATYTPPPAFTGETSFTYTAHDGLAESAPATVRISVVNTAPTVDDRTLYALEDEPLAIDVEPYASDAEGDPLTFEVVSGPAHGGVDLDASGSGVYTPDADWSGTDSFTYRAHDGLAWSAAGEITIDVLAVGDPLRVVEVAGSDRIRTAIEAARLAYPDGASTVIITTAFNWPDALGGAALAGTLDAPILLTAPDELSAAVASEVRALGASTAIVLGGTAAVSSQVEQSLRSIPGLASVRRVSGTNRYATARAVAYEVRSSSDEYDGTAFVVTGLDFPDALGASPLAAAREWPIYLVNAASGLDDSTVYAMRAAGVTTTIVVGGESAVPSALERDIASRVGCATVRIQGASRYETAVRVAAYGVSEAGLSWDKVALATGEDFPDALSGGALQGKSGSVMVLTPRTTLSDSVRTTFTTHWTEVFEVRYMGGTSAVSTSVRSAAEAALRPLE